MTQDRPFDAHHLPQSPQCTNGFDKPQAVAPHVEWRLIGDNEHLVQFYEKDATLIKSMLSYFAPCFKGNEAAIIVATKEHREEWENGVKANGFDVQSLRASGRYLSLDPQETLAKFMIGSTPDAQLFNEVIGTVVAAAVRDTGRVRIFGEMVAVLLAEGNEAGAIALERLWNDLARIHCFTLFCAYPIHKFPGQKNARSFLHICEAHARVIEVA